MKTKPAKSLPGKTGRRGAWILALASLAAREVVAQGRSLADLTLEELSNLRVDVRYGWKLRPDIELSIVGVDLLDRTHPEFGAPATRSEIERGVYVRLIWRQ